LEISAEIRWFWKGAGPPGLNDWFNSTACLDFAPGGGGLRTDRYLVDRKQTELGIKLRGNKPGVEVKGLVARLAHGCTEHPFVGPIEIWTKWSSEPLSLGEHGLTVVDKRRWLRKFDCSGAQMREIVLNREEHSADNSPFPPEGCDVEFTEVSLQGGRWVTLGFEAFGTLDTVVQHVREATRLLSQRQPPTLTEGWIASYPKWLRRVSSVSD
jgi:hypothetical protein